MWLLILEQMTLGKLKGSAFADKHLACYHTVGSSLNFGSYFGVQWLPVDFEEAEEN